MSNTVGGHSARLRAATSGGAASNSSHVSGRAACGRGNTRPGLEPPAILTSLLGWVKQFLFRGPESDPEKEFCGVRWRAGEERPDPEKEPRRSLCAESCWMLGWAGLYTPRNSGWSGSNRRFEFWLVQNRGCCGRKKVRGCSTGVPYSCLTRWFEADFQEAANFYWPLTSAGSPRWLPGKPKSYWLMTQAGPATRDTEFPLVEDPGCFSLCRRGRNLLGSLREASWGSVFSWFSEGAGEVRSLWYRVGGGAGSCTQFRYLSHGGRVTTAIVHSAIIDDLR